MPDTTKVTDVQDVLAEAPQVYMPSKFTQFVVNYQTKTPSGSTARFNRSFGTNHIQGATSETAVLGFLRRQHPGVDVQIFNLTWR